jgi:hypothetical protein
MSSSNRLRELSRCWMTAADLTDEVQLKRQLAAHAVHLAMVAHWFEDRERQFQRRAVLAEGRERPETPVTNVISFDVARGLRALSGN